MSPKYFKPVLMYKKQQGLGLPVALFIITIMSLIAVALSRLDESSSQSYGQNLLSSRAFYAAESGAQLRARSVLLASACECGVDQTYDFAVDGLQSCSAITSCNEFTANGGVYCTITSTGSCDNSNALRTIEVRLK